MKRISIALVLLMMMGFAGASSSATLSWGTTPAQAAITLDNNSTISANYGFGLFTGAFAHVYNFTASTVSPVVANVIELFNENVTISSITLDSIAMTFDVVNQRWTGSGVSGINHVIALSGTVNKVGQQYLISASTVSSVPVPAAIWLFGSALGGLSCLARRKAGLKV